MYPSNNENIFNLIPDLTHLFHKPGEKEPNPIPGTVLIDGEYYQRTNGDKFRGGEIEVDKVFETPITQRALGSAQKLMPITPTKAVLVLEDESEVLLEKKGQKFESSIGEFPEKMTTEAEHYMDATTISKINVFVDSLGDEFNYDNYQRMLHSVLPSMRNHDEDVKYHPFFDIGISRDDFSYSYRMATLERIIPALLRGEKANWDVIPGKRISNYKFSRVAKMYNLQSMQTMSKERRLTIYIGDLFGRCNSQYPIRTDGKITGESFTEFILKFVQGFEELILPNTFFIVPFDNMVVPYEEESRSCMDFAVFNFSPHRMRNYLVFGNLLPKSVLDTADLSYPQGSDVPYRVYKELWMTRLQISAYRNMHASHSEDDLSEKYMRALMTEISDRGVSLIKALQNVCPIALSTIYIDVPIVKEEVDFTIEAVTITSMLNLRKNLVEDVLYSMEDLQTFGIDKRVKNMMLKYKILSSTLQGDVIKYFLFDIKKSFIRSDIDLSNPVSTMIVTNDGILGDEHRFVDEYIVTGVSGHSLLDSLGLAVKSLHRGVSSNFRVGSSAVNEQVSKRQTKSEKYRKHRKRFARQTNRYRKRVDTSYSGGIVIMEIRGERYCDEPLNIIKNFGVGVKTEEIDGVYVSTVDKIRRTAREYQRSRNWAAYEWLRRLK